MTRRNFPALDWFRLVAAVLVVAIHTGPLSSFSPVADLWFTRVLARVAVPYFSMVSGYFLARQNWKDTGRLWRHTLVLYVLSAIAYLPLNIYAGDPVTWRKLIFNGTFYHLWYLPALLLALPLARALAKNGRWGLGIAGVLYLLGLGGDSYYGLAGRLPGLGILYEVSFCFWDYTRNGLFFLPLFLLLGAAFAVRPLPAPRTSARLALVGLLAMTAEAFALHGLNLTRHDSMYLFLPLTMWGLFGLLLAANAGQDRAVRRTATLVYLVHPWCIVLVRRLARALGLWDLLVENSAGHFAAVVPLSVALAFALQALAGARSRRLPPDVRAWREIDPDALRQNAAALRAALPEGCALMAVVKADAYGHGAILTARALAREGADLFAVACLSEGIALRKGGIRGKILILGWTDPARAPLLRRWRLCATVADAEHGRALSAQGVPLHVHLAVDTGMHRLGIPAEDTAHLAEMFALPNLHVDGVYSHLCTSDGDTPADRAFACRQTETFTHTLAMLRGLGLDPGLTHLQASYGVLNPGCVQGQRFGAARLGLALYGVRSDSTPVESLLPLRPVLSLRARVAAVHQLRAGEGAGYGLAFTARRDTCLAVLAIGYADGLPRDYADKGGVVLLQGRRCPVVGRVCMDQMLVDATDLPQPPQAGQIATLMGTDGEETLRAEEVAVACGTITNELLSRLGPRLGLQVREK